MRHVTFSELSALNAAKAIPSLYRRVGGHAVAGWRSLFAQEGRGFTITGEQFFLTDMMKLFFAVARANGGFTPELVKLYVTAGAPLSREIWQLQQTYRNDMLAMSSRVNEVHAELLEEDSTFDLPFTIRGLAMFDQQHGTKHAAEAAGVFLELAMALTDSGKRDCKEANHFVKDRYAQLLAPYLDQSVDSSRPEAARNEPHCIECVRGFAALGITPQATKYELESVHKDLAKVWHPDRFANEDERLRRRAEDEFKKVQAAYQHLKGHAFAGTVPRS